MIDVSRTDTQGAAHAAVNRARQAALAAEEAVSGVRLAALTPSGRKAESAPVSDGKPAIRGPVTVAWLTEEALMQHTVLSRPLSLRERTVGLHGLGVLSVAAR